MKVLSIRQPWAWLIVNGLKDIENRTWNTKFRGEFLIHASSHKMTRKEWDHNLWWMGEKGFNIAMDALPDHNNLEYGGIIGKATLVNVIEHKHFFYSTWHRDNYNLDWWNGDCYGFVLKNAQPVDFIPCKGQLNFFEKDINL